MHSHIYRSVLIVVQPPYDKGANLLQKIDIYKDSIMALLSEAYSHCVYYSTAFKTVLICFLLSLMLE
jgi:hypothetical protein